MSLVGFCNIPFLLGPSKAETWGSQQGQGDTFKLEISLERAVELIKRDTRHFAKRQLTWFRRDPNIRWVEKQGKTEQQVEAELLQQIREKL